jgi:hypothetical protein
MPGNINGGGHLKAVIAAEGDSTKHLLNAKAPVNRAA